MCFTLRGIDYYRRMHTTFLISLLAFFVCALRCGEFIVIVMCMRHLWQHPWVFVLGPRSLWSYLGIAIILRNHKKNEYLRISHISFIFEKESYIWGRWLYRHIVWCKITKSNIEVNGYRSRIDINSHLSLVSLDFLINSLCSFEIDIDDVCLPLNIVVFEFKVHRQGYDIQDGCKRSP